MSSNRGRIAVAMTLSAVKSPISDRLAISFKEFQEVRCDKPLDRVNQCPILMVVKINMSLGASLLMQRMKYLRHMWVAADIT